MVVRLTAPELAALRATLGDAVLLGLDPVTYRRVVRLQARLDRAVALAERRARRPAEGVGGALPSRARHHWMTISGRTTHTLLRRTYHRPSSRR